MRNADEWAAMYLKHIRSLSPEELEAFVAAVQLDAVKHTVAVVNGSLPVLEGVAGEYPEELFR